MNTWVKKIYDRSPYQVKRQMANLEAYRRIRVRRGGDYQADYQSLDLLEMLQENQEEKQLLLLNELLSYIGRNIPYYQEKDIPKQVEYLSKLSDLPIMNKEILRGESVRLINENHRSALWKGWTSGSTGSSLHYHRDKHSMRYEYALYERLYEFACQQENPIRARLSNVVIAKPGAKPPYWFYLRAMRQLQCSTDHIEPSTAALYLEALARYGVVLGTGYTYSWLRLAEGVLNLKERSNPLKAIVTDSEGITLSQKKVVEEAFSCPVYQTYGSSELGMVAVQCEKGHYHLLDRIHVEVVDSQGRVLPYGEEGEIVVTDLRSFDAPFLRYRSGDLGILGKDGCGCKWKGPYLSSIAGRVEDYVVTSKGVRMTRVNRIVKGVEGIKAMQIVQDKPGQLHVRVIPDEHFCPEEMKKMHKKGESFMGKIDFSWELVETLETTASGKVRYLIRNFEA